MNEDHQRSAREGWFDKQENVRKVLFFLAGACGLMVLIDVIFRVTGFDKHPYFKWEQWPGFYGVYAFVASVVLVFAAKYILRPLVKKPENYYDSVEKGGGDA